VRAEKKFVTSTYSYEHVIKYVWNFMWFYL